MQVIFMDESGYSFNWEANLDKQPYYVLSAVCFPSEQLLLAYKKIRSEVSNLNLEGAVQPLGQGFEIKARDVASGSGYWRTHNDERNAVRDTILKAPKEYRGTAFVVVIDKLAHRERYAYPANPYQLSLEFIFERLQMYLSDINDYGICIYDQNKRLEDILQNAAAALVREGSEFIYFSRFYNSLVIKTFPIERIIEFSSGRSENSIGLQVADFFATMTYTYVKDGKPSPCGWWNELESSLHRKDGQLQGVGYKEFP
jgi:hypothetical protein